MSATGLIGFFCFCFGACIASFLNVVIWRMPRGESIVSPPSHCPRCNAPIRWYRNIPILSWLFLRGRCANCRKPISPRYILIEALGGVLFLATFLKFSAAASPAVLGFAIAGGVVYWIWISLMIVGSMIDFDHKLLPDFVTIGGMVLGLLFNASRGFLVGKGAVWTTCLLYSVGGLALGFGLLWLIRCLGSKAFGREAMGMGDVLLMGAVGALFGPLAVLATLILSSLLGSLVGVGLILFSKARFGKMVEIPYGPYICLGCLAWMFFDEALVRGWLMLVQR